LFAREGKDASRLKSFAIATEKEGAGRQYFIVVR
jgi:hypothetical protein